jgi:hypothetical protein
MSGFFGKVWDSLTGDTATKTADQQAQLVKTNQADATANVKAYGQQAADSFDPFINGGAGTKRYFDASGADGTTAANGAYADWMGNNPLMALLKSQQKTAAQQANGPGGSAPGTSVAEQAANRVAMQNWETNVGNLEKASGVEQQANLNKAGVVQRTGEDASGVDQWGTNASGNAAQMKIGTSSILGNSFLGALGTVVGGLTPGKNGVSPFGSLYNGAASVGNDLLNLGRSPTMTTNPWSPVTSQNV